MLIHRHVSHQGVSEIRIVKLDYCSELAEDQLFFLTFD